jgi:hypothetical protein
VAVGSRHRDDRADDLYRLLTSHGVRLSVRKGVLRMSLGLYNDAADVDRVLELVREWLEARIGIRTMRSSVVACLAVLLVYRRRETSRPMPPPPR